MDFREKKRSIRILNVTSLVDVMFILIIFFLLSTTFIEQPNIKLDLPTAVHSEKSSVEPTALVTLGRGGEIFVNQKSVQKSQLEASLRELVNRVPDKAVVLRADKRVAYGTVVFVMDTAKQVGFRKIVATTTREEEKEEGAAGH